MANTDTVRMSRDIANLITACIHAQRSTCIRRHVGCVLTNEKGHILATGFNGVSAGMLHCREVPGARCPGANAKSGEGLDECYAIHAETNALLQCPDVWSIDTAYCTSLPCIHCLKLLLNTSCKRIVYMEGYPNPAFESLWQRELRHVPQNDILEYM